MEYTFAKKKSHLRCLRVISSNISFYRLVAMLGLSGDLNRQMRAALTDSFGKRRDIGMLPLLRIGNHLFCVTSVLVVVPLALVTRVWASPTLDESAIDQQG